MVRKRAVHFAIELAHCAPQATIELGRVCTRYAVAAVHDDGERPGELYIRGDPLQISLGDVGFTVGAAA